MKKSLDNFTINGILITAAIEVSNLDELLDIRRSQRPEVFVDRDGMLRVALAMGSGIERVIFVSLPVPVLSVIRKAQEFPGETFIDSVLNCIEENQ